MINKKQLLNMVNQLNNMNLLIETYEEIAAMDMRKIRSSVLNNRGFIEELEEIYQQIESSYQEQIVKLLAKRHSKTGTLSKKNGKSVTVFISANARLYGDIVQRTFTSFQEFINKNQTDVVVMGKLGQSLMQENNPTLQYNYQDLPDTNIQQNLMSNLLTLLLEYEKIYIFYGKFQSIVTQKPYMLDVYGQANKSDHTINSSIQYLFEPSLEKILQFFEEQIFATIIEQSFHESELAKYSARMVALDKATGNISDQMKKLNLQSRIVQHHIQNQKQAQSLNSLLQWGRS